MTNLKYYIENPDNPQTITDENYRDLVKSLREDPETLAANNIAFATDYKSPISGVDYSGQRVVIAGNKRLRALKEIYGEAADVPDEWFFDLTPLGEEKRRRWLVKSNVQSGEWVADTLSKLYSEDELRGLLPTEDLDDLLASIPQTTTGGKTDADAAPEKPSAPVSQRGGVYVMGKHLVMCGDATSSDDVAKLMGADRADMIFTDPPYNVSIGDRNKAINAAGKKHGQRNLGGRIEENILGDSGMTDEECGEKLWKPAFANMQKFAKDYCAMYVTMPQGGTHMMMMMMMRGSWQVKHELMWLKDQPTFSMGRLDYDYKHEPICYVWNKSHRFFGKGEFTKSVWEFPKPRQSKDHPTMKPVALVVNAVQNSSQDGEIVMDLFGGSGTTAIACEQTGRVARLMELDPKYVDVIRRRWAEFVHGEGCDWAALTPEAQST